MWKLPLTCKFRELFFVSRWVFLTWMPSSFFTNSMFELPSLSMCLESNGDSFSSSFRNKIASPVFYFLNESPWSEDLSILSWFFSFCYWSVLMMLLSVFNFWTNSADCIVIFAVVNPSFGDSAEPFDYFFASLFYFVVWSVFNYLLI